MSKEISKEIAEVLFKEHSANIYRMALFLSKSRDLAEDITQETLIQVFRKYNTYDPSKPIQPWINKITLNITRNILRRQKWLNFFEEIPENGSSEALENTVLKSEEEKEIWREINSLSMKNREVIILHFYSGMKLKEIAEVLDIPLGTCKSRLNSALNSLRIQLHKSGFKFFNKGGDICETV